MDSYLTYLDSGLAAVQFVRAIMAGTFPLFTHQMIRELGANISMMILAIVVTIFCAAPPCLVFYGERIRESSRFADQALRMKNKQTIEEND